MSNDTVAVLNLETGATGVIRRKWYENPAINAGILVEVDPHQKPYVPELYKSKVVLVEDVETDDERETQESDPLEETE